MYKVSLDIGELCAGSLEAGAELAKRLGRSEIECGYILDGTALYEADGCEVERLRNKLIDGLLRIVLMTSPDRALDFGELKKFMRNAHLLGVENLKLTAAEYTDKAKLDYIRGFIRAAGSFGIGVVFENRAHSALADDASMTALYDAVKSSDSGEELSENVFFALNPFEFVKESHHPFFHMFYASRLKNMIRFLRLNDGLYSGDAKELCQGNGEIKELVSILLARSYGGYFSVSPYSGGDFEAAAAKCIEGFKNIVKKC